MADAVNRAKHGDRVTFAANQHINPTNICIAAEDLRLLLVRAAAEGRRRVPLHDGAGVGRSGDGEQHADARVPHRRRARHEGGARVLQRDVPRPQGAPSAGAHQGAHRGRDRAHRAHREDVRARHAHRAARGGARHDARRRRRGVQPRRARDDRRQEAVGRGIHQRASRGAHARHSHQLHDAVRPRRDVSRIA